MNKNRSVFQSNVTEAHFPALSKDLHADVAIVGGGITGITTAYLLALAGKKVVLMEQHAIGKGATGNSTGNLYVTVGNKGMHAILSKFNEETLKKVVEARKEGINFIARMVQENQIACHFSKADWYLFSAEEKNRLFIEKEKEAAMRAGLQPDENITLPVDHQFGFAVRDQYQFNPFQYLTALARKASEAGALIFEQTTVLNIEENENEATLTTGNHKIIANEVIMATHTPKGFNILQTLLGPYREYAVAVKLQGAYPADGIYWDYQETEHYSLRPYETVHGKVLLALGESHKVGQKKNNEECFAKIEKYLHDRFKVQSVEHRWAAQQYKPADMLPYIGKSPGQDRIYLATGFSADGLPYGTIAAMIITDQITGKENRYSKTFDTHRHTPIASAKDFIKENTNVAMQYFKNLPLVKDAGDLDDIQMGEGKILEVKGHKCAAFKDDKGEVHLSSALCPHLYCVVSWNSMEKTWDCPCHGSRFSCTGKVIEGPAYHDLRKIEK